VEFIHASVLELHDACSGWPRRAAPGGGLIVRHGPRAAMHRAAGAELGVQEVLANRDYEPQAIARDQHVAQALHALGIAFSDYKDQVLLDRDEVLTQQGRPYSVFTPYKRAWLQSLDDFQLNPTRRSLRPHLAPPAGERLPCQSWALAHQFARAALPTGMSGAQRLLQDFVPRMAAYQEARDFPGRKGVSYLSVHLRFGTVSIRQLARWRQNRPSRAARAHRPGCPSWPGATSTS
jgi:deoxyribodipyrimidine photo-lyase